MRVYHAVLKSIVVQIDIRQQHQDRIYSNHSLSYDMISFQFNVQLNDLRDHIHGALLRQSEWQIIKPDMIES